MLLGGCTAPQTQGASASWAKAYPTLQELTRDADAILVGSVEKSTPASAVDGIPFTDATVTVKTWFKGKEPASAVTVKQTGVHVQGASVSAVDPPQTPASLKQFPKRFQRWSLRLSDCSKRSFVRLADCHHNLSDPDSRSSPEQQQGRRIV